MRLGRKCRVVDCRETAGLGLGGGLAQRGTLAEAAEPDIIVLSMGPSPRHITKPVCEITYGLREAGFNVSVLVLKMGIGPPEELMDQVVGAAYSNLFPEEEEQIRRHKLALIHVGNVPRHFIPKVKVFLRNVALPAVVVSQAPVTMKDFAEAGIRTREYEPEVPETKGMVVEVVTGVIRGQTCSQEKLDEIIGKVKYWMERLKDGQARLGSGQG
ncbi:MAG: methyl-coenzyme M reductase I operon protein C [Hadesarchaea archaeon]|nr:MAG: methyl-coenzyme M reductase I operon protein C [Hadesarchaea archaeon]